MATYAQLQQDLAGWSARTQSAVQIPTFITLAEGRITREVRTRDMQQLSTIEVTKGVGPLPDRFLGFTGVAVADAPAFSSAEIQYLAPDALLERAIQFGFDREMYYTLIGNEIHVIPEQDVSLRTAYYQAYLPLSDTNPTNALLTEHYALYLYAGLIELWNYLQDAEQEIRYLAQFDNVVQQLHRSERRKGRSGPFERIPISAP